MLLKQVGSIPKPANRGVWNVFGLNGALLYATQGIGTYELVTDQKRLGGRIAMVRLVSGSATVTERMSLQKGKQVYDINGRMTGNVGKAQIR
jgi:hypothetical protein